MITSSADFETQHAQRYLAPLCQHFAHKVEVEIEGGRGVCRFICGTATLEASETSLHVIVGAADRSALAETMSVVERHLVRFAFRENPRALQWHGGAQGDADQAQERVT